jgi:hypothetical protein
MEDPLGRINGHGAPMANGGGAPHDSRRTRLTPPGAASITDAIAGLLDEAHASLSTRDLAALLLAVRRMTGAPDGLLRPPPRSPGADAYLAAITRALAAAAAGRDDLGPWLEAYLDEVAARPRGSALREAA